MREPSSTSCFAVNLDLLRSSLNVVGVQRPQCLRRKLVRSFGVAASTFSITWQVGAG